MAEGQTSLHPVPIIELDFFASSSANKHRIIPFLFCIYPSYSSFAPPPPLSLF